MSEPNRELRHFELTGPVDSQVFPSEAGIFCVTARSELGTLVADEAQLLSILEAQRALKRPLPVVTARGSIASHPLTVADWISRYPAVRICLDLGDWMLGSEALLGRSDEWRALVQRLAPNVDVLVLPSGGSERQLPTRSWTAPILANLSRRRFGAVRAMGLSPGVRVVAALPSATQIGSSGLTRR